MGTVIRVAVVYAIIVAALRIMGKREFAQLSPLELITLLLIPDLLSSGVIGDDYSLTNSLTAVLTLFAITFGMAVLMQRFKPVETLVASSPTVLVAHGKMYEHNMNRERISPDELFTEMHKSGLTELNQVKWAILESDGQISLVPVDKGKQGERKQEEPRAV